MASAQSRSKIRHSKQRVKLRETLKGLSDALLGKSKEIIDTIASNPVTSTAIAGTLAVSPFAYHAVNSQLNGTFQELSSTQQEVLSHFLDQTTELLNQKTMGTSSSQLDDHSRKLLSANSFTVLRNVDGRGKGRLIRFLSEVELIKATQSTVSLSGADLRDIDLQDAWLPQINLNGAYALNGNLQNVNLKGSYLADTNLTGSNLTEANLTDANLTGATLTKANLTKVNLTEANLTNAHLDIDKAVQDGATFCRTTMPDGSFNTSSCPKQSE